MVKINNNRVAHEICESIKDTCKTYKDRCAGSESEALVSGFFAERAGNSCDEVSVEEFKVHRGAHYGWIPISVTAVILGIAAYFFSPMITLLLIVIAAVPLVFQYLLKNRMLDPLFKESVSKNVTAVKHCSGEKKRTLYFVANVDAGMENCVKYRCGGIMFFVIVIFDIIGLLYYAALSVARWIFVGGIGAEIAEGVLLYMGLAGIIFVIPLVLTYFTESRRIVTDGANSNLSGCFTALKTLEALKDVKLENTDIGVIFTGSGSVGNRGAKAWCDKHAAEIDKENTTFICLSTLRELKSLNVSGSELGRKNDKETVALVLDCAKNAGLSLKSSSLPIVATESVAFRDKKLKSVGIFGVNKNLPEYYHTRYDSYDNLSEECIAAGFGLALEIINGFSGEKIFAGSDSTEDKAEDTPLDIKAEPPKQNDAPIGE